MLRPTTRVSTLLGSRQSVLGGSSRVGLVAERARVGDLGPWPERARVAERRRTSRRLRSFANSPQHGELAKAQPDSSIEVRDVARNANGTRTQEPAPNTRAGHVEVGPPHCGHYPAGPVRLLILACDVFPQPMETRVGCTATLMTKVKVNDVSTSPEEIRDHAQVGTVKMKT